MTVLKFTRSSTRIGRAKLHEGLLSYVAYPSFGLRNTGTKKKVEGILQQVDPKEQPYERLLH